VTTRPSIAELLDYRQSLAASSDTPSLDVDLLLCYCLRKERSYLRTWPEVEVAEPLVKQFMTLLSRRRQGEPMAYLIGSQAFWSLSLTVNPSTLIPRPETELLVEKALECAQGSHSEKAVVRVIDLGTGTGAIALALAHERPHWLVEGCDSEVAAVALAETNRQRLGMESVRFYQSNWFEAVGDKRFDIIVSNPPYIHPDDPCLQQGGVRFEPLTALVADRGGIAHLEAIIEQSKQYLEPGGWLLLEHSCYQRDIVCGLLNHNGFSSIETFKDLAGLDRVSRGKT